jgi:PIN domain nuclease of toxin-antitoxin system
MGNNGMILLDTHIWIWWVDNSPRLTDSQRSWIDQHQADGLGLSVISCWEVAKAVESGRLTLSIPVQDWLNAAIAYPGIRLLDLTIPIIVESTQLTGFHRDPGDQLIVATARICQIPLLTADAKILAYPDVVTLQ